MYTLAAFRSLCLSLHTPPCLTTHVWSAAVCFSGVAVLVVVIVADHSSLARPPTAAASAWPPSRRRVCSKRTALAHPHLASPDLSGTPLPCHTVACDLSVTLSVGTDLSGTLSSTSHSGWYHPPGIPSSLPMPVCVDESATHACTAVPPSPQLRSASTTQAGTPTHNHAAPYTGSKLCRALVFPCPTLTSRSPIGLAISCTISIASPCSSGVHTQLACGTHRSSVPPVTASAW